MLRRPAGTAPGSRPPLAAMLVALVTLALAACASASGGSAVLSGVTGPRAATGLEPQPGESPAKTAALPPAARAAAPATPERLKGLTVAELKAGLGAPTLLRLDGPAQLWQYAGSGCVLHVFLYDDHGTFRVTHAEVRVDDPGVPNPPTCVEWKGRPPAHSALPIRPAVIRHDA